MGSLMPGWDKPRQLPKGLEEDYKNDPIDLKKLRSLDALRRSSLEPRSPATSPSAAYAASSPGRLRRSSMDDALKAAMTSPRDKQASAEQSTAEPGHAGEPSPAWWSRMDSASFNERPYEEDRDSWRHGSYMPQHTEATQGTAEEGDTFAEMVPH